VQVKKWEQNTLSTTTVQFTTARTLGCTKSCWIKQPTTEDVRLNTSSWPQKLAKLQKN